MYIHISYLLYYDIVAASCILFKLAAHCNILYDELLRFKHYYVVFILYDIIQFSYHRPFIVVLK